MASSAEFVEILQGTLSADNAIRPEAERKYATLRDSQPAQTVAELFRVLLRSDLGQAVRESAAVLLRQCLGAISGERSIWRQLGESAQTDVKAQLLPLLASEAIPQVRHKVADIIQSLGNQLIEIGDAERPTTLPAWPELMPSLMGIVCDPSKDGGLRGEALWAVKELVCSVWQFLLANVPQTLQVLQGCANDPTEAVRANAACLLVELVDNISSAEDRRSLASLSASCCQTIRQLASGSSYERLDEVLQAFANIENACDFFKDDLGTLLELMSGIAKSRPEETSKKLALEVLVNFAERKPKLIAKTGSFLQETLNVCVVFLRELDDDIDTWAADDDEEAEEEEMPKMGKDCVDRLSRCMNEKERFPQVMNILQPIIRTLLQQPEWKSLVAGVTVLSQIAEYIEDEAVINQMTGAVKAQLSSQHPRVRHAAWTALTQIVTDHDELLAGDAWPKQLLPEFLTGLDDPIQRANLRCMEAFQHYGENVEREELEPFVAQFMAKLGVRLQGAACVQRKAITFVAVIAGQLEDGFAAYYGPLMPILKDVISKNLHKVEERKLLGKVFECISLLAKTVGPEGFRGDAEVIMQAMIQATQVPGLPADDPVKEYMLAAAERICSTMKADFVPYVQYFLPGVLEKLSLSPKEFGTDGAFEGLGEGTEVNLTITRVDGKPKVLMMTTSEVEDMHNALDCLHTFVEELGKGYAPFLAQTAHGLLPVFDFGMQEDIRELAFETWGELCNCARQTGAKAELTELCKEFLKRILPKFDETDVDVQASVSRCQGVTVCLQKAGPQVLDAGELRHICQVSLKILSESFTRREEDASGRAARAPQLAGDEDDEDEEGRDDEESLRIKLCEIAGALMEHHPDSFLVEGLPLYLPVVDRLVGSGKVEDIKLALFITCDMLDYLRERVVEHWPRFLPNLLRCVTHEDPHIRQPACYGVSLAAKVPAFGQFAAESARNLAEIISRSRGRAKKKSEKHLQACADNALSGLLEVLQQHQQAVAAQSANLWEVWLSGLPCQVDEQEGHKNHKALLLMIQQQVPAVVGENGANLGKLFGILIDVYKTDMADEETSVGTGKLLLSAPEASLQTWAAGYQEKRVKKLERVIREARGSAAA